MPTRNQSIDIMKGIAILLVVAGHMGDIPMDPWRRIIFSFHMPLFFILSGYFFKVKEPLTLVKSDFRRLIIPYIMTAVVLILWASIFAIKGGDYSLVDVSIIKAVYGTGSAHHSPVFGRAPSIGAIWFLLALFWCRSVYNVIACKCLNMRLLIGGGY